MIAIISLLVSINDEMSSIADGSCSNTHLCP